MTTITNQNLPAILTGFAVSILVLSIKILLDFRIAHWWIKWFYWLPVRNYFRTRPINLSGKWDEVWESEESNNFVESTQRHSHPVIRQLGHYCYSEHIANGKTYGIFGKITNDYFIGEWYDKNDRIGYFGTFHLHIKDSKNMNGKWLGHSKSFQGIRQGNWSWVKIK